MKKIALLITIMMTGNFFANMNPKGFKRFSNYYFVETGTYEGEGVKLALKAGFPVICSIEIIHEFVIKATACFAHYPNVHIMEGDSGKILWDVIKNMDRPITFWLDGHNSNGPGPNNTNKNTPLMEELEQIKMHPIKCHTIIIDDIRCCETIHFDYLTKEQIINKILEINPEYKITYINGGIRGEIKDDILVARIP
ncbi:hypothetical protein ACFLYA_00825 [Candidatus Dependentiae bacterium]